MLQFFCREQQNFAHARDKRVNNTQFLQTEFFALNYHSVISNMYFFLKVNRIFVVLLLGAVIWKFVIHLDQSDLQHMN